MLLVHARPPPPRRPLPRRRCWTKTSDAYLLSSPSQALLDPDIRREVAPGLSLPRVAALLRRFEPDEDAPEPLPPGVRQMQLALIW